MSFAEIYTNKLFGAIHGFDRLRFRGTIREISTASGFTKVLNFLHVLMTNFKVFLMSITRNMVSSAQRYCNANCIQYAWQPGSMDKDAVAKQVLATFPEGYTGPVFCLATIEGCQTFKLFSNPVTKKLEPRMETGKCTHLYIYFNHPEYGLGHIRVQTWAPFGINICINGRSWLENQLRKNGVGYVKAENCFPWIEDVKKAQELLDSQLRSNWDSLLQGLVDEYAPWLPLSLGSIRADYYWSAEETEFATDYMFKDQRELDRMFRMFVRYGMLASDSAAVMRFMGRKHEWHGNGKAPDDLHSDCREYHEGVRIKHSANGNSVKAYNKQGTVFRVETTINNARGFYVYRHPEDNKTLPKRWMHMRKGIADLARRAVVSRQINERYAEHIAVADTSERLGEICERVCRRASLRGRNGKNVKVRALRPGDSLDGSLLEFLKKGGWDINGFANRDLDMFLNGGKPPKDAADKKRRSAKATRLIRLLRAHKLVVKVNGRNKYRVTEYGHKLSTAIALAKEASVKKLGENVA